jgi:hypothetical protein
LFVVEKIIDQKQNRKQKNANSINIIEIVEEKLKNYCYVHIPQTHCDEKCPAMTILAVASKGTF